MAGNKQIVVFMAAMAAVIGICSAATFTVGDKTGWTIPTSSSFYSNWASKQKVQVGDTLVFQFPAGTHTVAEVSKSAYDSCNTGSPLSAVMTTAPASVTVKSPGTHYYICTITGHCAAGQKIAITAAASSSAAPAPKSSKKGGASAPTPAPSSSGAAAEAPAAAAPTGAAAGPSGVIPTTSGSAPTGATAAPPSKNFAATNAAGVGLVGLVSTVVAALMA